ncbi:MAG: hypothetical protein EBS90_10385 [Betaproteobacteria bacterium]|nr:hypothetical protein [Betaproteobacteria bacterium]
MTVLDRPPVIGERFIVPPEQQVRVASLIRHSDQLVFDNEGTPWPLSRCRAVSTTQGALDVLSNLLASSPRPAARNPLDVVSNPSSFATNPIAAAVVNPKISQADLAAAIAAEADEGRLSLTKRQLQSDVAKLTREVTSLKEQARAATDNVKMLREERQELAVEIVRLRREKAAFSNNTSTIRDLTSALKDAQEKLEILRAVSDSDNQEAKEESTDSSPYVDHRRLLLEGVNVSHNDD